MPYHKALNDRDIRSFIKKYPFAFLTGMGPDKGPIATQLPLFIELGNGGEVVRGHIMKGTDHHEAFLHNDKVLVVFTGRHTYVSGTWYSNPNSPSTWNYMSVHIRGRIRFVGEAELEDILRSVSLHFEGQNRASATAYDNLPVSFRKKALEMIVGFEIEIQNIDTVFKLSQDRDAASYRNIIAKLKEQDEDGRTIAAEMEKREGEVFGNG